MTARVDRAAAIAVLLVDDDVEWVTTAGSALEDAADGLSVVTATGGWEALDLLETQDFDCVVCDYRMPDFDGIALLERIRADVGDIPFILITGSGSESIASRAISSRVTDYFIKEPQRDQSRALASRVRTAVETYRTEQALAAARRRFTELFERVPDPMAITDERDDIRDVNEAFRDVFGGGSDALGGTALDAVVGDIEHLGENESTDAAVHTLATETSGGQREFIVRRFPLDRPDSREFGYAFTDVTRQRDRQRELERFHELGADVRELLLSTESRADLERAFCETVVGSLEGATAMLARGSEPGDATVHATAGDVPDGLQRALFECRANGNGVDHPVGDALVAGDTRYVADVSTVQAEWARTAQSDGVDALVAVPVEQHGITVGVFVVCAADSSTLDRRTRERLHGLVTSLGDAIGIVNRLSALTADHVVRVELSVGGGSEILTDLGQSTATPIDVVSALPTADGETALYLDVDADDRSAIGSWLEDAEHVSDHEIVTERRPARLRIETAAQTLPSVLARHAADVRSVRVDGGQVHATVDVPVSDDIRDIVDALETAYDSVAVASLRNVERDGPQTPGESTVADLTEKQRRALETAFHEGYFERPRVQSADDVAAVLDVSRSTFLQHLRAAERKLLAEVFDGG